LNSVQLNQTPPTGLTPQSINAALNNRLAVAMSMGDPRMAVKKYDRAGLSRGGAQWNQAGIEAAQRLSDGVADAYSSQIQDQSYNAGLQLQGQQAQEQTAQALGGLQQQRDYSNQMAALQRQQTMLGFAGGLLRGLMN
jgi:hypothetical protein